MHYLLSALLLCLSLVAQAQPSAQALYEKGLDARLNYQLDQAIEQLSTAHEQSARTLKFRIRSNLAEVYLKKEQNRKAIELYERPLPDKTTDAKAWKNFKQGRLAMLRNDYKEAIALLEKALENFQKEPDAKTHELGELQHWLGELYLAEERYDEAITQLSESVLTFKELGKDYEGLLAKSYLLMGKAYTAFKEPKEAKGWYIRSFELAEQFFGRVHIAVAKHHLDIAQSCSRDNNAQSQDCYNAALGIVRQLENIDKIYEIRILVGLAERAVENRSYETALAKLQQAGKLATAYLPERHPLNARRFRAEAHIALANEDNSSAIEHINAAITACLAPNHRVRGSELPDFSAVYYPFELLEALSYKGNILLEIALQKKEVAQLKSTLQLFDRTREELLRLRGRQSVKQNKYRYSRLLRDVCNGGVQAAYALQSLGVKSEDYFARTFEYMEFSKSSILLEALRDLQARKVSGIPKELLEKEQKYKVNIAYLEEQLFYEHQQTKTTDTAWLQALQNKLQTEKNAYEDLVLMLKKEYSDYYQLKYRPEVVSLQRLRDILAPNEILLEYLIVDRQLYLLAFGKEEQRMQRIELPKDFSLQVLKFMVALRDRQYEPFVANSPALYDLLIRPVKNIIKGKSLLIIPDADLNYISFELLMKEAPTQPTGGDYRKLALLIYDNPVFYNYSATLFTQSKTTKDIRAPKGMLSMAPDFQSSDFASIRSKLDVRDDTSSVFQALPAALEEVGEVSKILNGEAFAGRGATESQFKSIAQQYAVLHLATHAVVNNNNPLYSKLILLDDEENDGLLHTYELYNMKLNAELVTLSACNSGIGTIQKGEGVVSLARGFAYAGTPNVVMSLWPVPDATTKELMSLFYQNLEKGLAKNEALHQAKLTFLKEGNKITSAPFFWGSFVVVGNSEPLQLTTANLSGSGQGSFAWWPYAAAIGGVLLLLVAIFAVRQKGKEA